MKAPLNYQGPAEIRVPFGYIEVTTLLDRGTIGIPGPEHPYCKIRNAIEGVLLKHTHFGGNPQEVAALVDAIMDAL